MAQVNWRTINIDALDPDSSTNFDLSTLTPGVQPVATEEVQQLANQVRQLLRGGDAEGALKGALENPPYGADDRGKVPPANTIQYMTNKRHDETDQTDPDVPGNPRSDRHRGPSINQTSRHDPHAAAHIQLRSRPRAMRCPHEIPVHFLQDNPPHVCPLTSSSSYKGMASTTPSQKQPPKQMTPQATGFSQIQSRGTAEGQGHAMSVLLSWHEKVPVHFRSLLSAS